MMTETTTETKAPDKRWYVIHTYSGYENKVKTNLEHRIESMGIEDKIFQVLVPMEDEIEIQQGQRHTVQKKVYPGYVLVEMIMDDDSLVRRPQHAGRHRLRRRRQHPGRPSEPIPLDENEVKKILKQMGVETPKYQVASPRARASGSSTGRSPSSSAWSTRSTPSATRSRCWCPSSAARRPSSWTSSRSRSSKKGPNTPWPRRSESS